MKASNGAIEDCSNRASLPRTRLPSHGRVEPGGPEKQIASVISPGVRTSAVALAIEVSHSGPIAFQYSSSWSANAFSAASTV